MLPQNLGGDTTTRSYPWRKYVQTGKYHKFNLPIPQENPAALCGVKYRGFRYSYWTFCEYTPENLVGLCPKCVQINKD